MKKRIQFSLIKEGGGGGKIHGEGGVSYDEKRGGLLGRVQQTDQKKEAVGRLPPEGKARHLQ